MMSRPRTAPGAGPGPWDFGRLGDQSERSGPGFADPPRGGPAAGDGGGREAWEGGRTGELSWSHRHVARNPLDVIHDQDAIKQEVTGSLCCFWHSLGFTVLW